MFIKREKRFGSILLLLVLFTLKQKTLLSSDQEVNGEQDNHEQYYQFVGVNSTIEGDPDGYDAIYIDNNTVQLLPKKKYISPFRSYSKRDGKFIKTVEEDSDYDPTEDEDTNFRKTKTLAQRKKAFDKAFSQEDLDSITKYLKNVLGQEVKLEGQAKFISKVQDIGHAKVDRHQDQEKWDHEHEIFKEIWTKTITNEPEKDLEITYCGSKFKYRIDSETRGSNVNTRFGLSETSRKGISTHELAENARQYENLPSTPQSEAYFRALNGDSRDDISRGKNASLKLCQAIKDGHLARLVAIHGDSFRDRTYKYMKYNFNAIRAVKDKKIKAHELFESDIIPTIGYASGQQHANTAENNFTNLVMFNAAHNSIVKQEHFTSLTNNPDSLMKIIKEAMTAHISKQDSNVNRHIEMSYNPGSIDIE